MLKRAASAIFLTQPHLQPLFFDAQYPLTSKNSPPILPAIESSTLSNKLICKREVRRKLALPDGPETSYISHVVATNWSPEEKAAQDVPDWHNQRGQAESMIKELKHGVGLERVPCGETWANAVWFRLGAIVCNLVIGFQRLNLSHRLGAAHDRYVLGAETSPLMN